MAQQDPNAQYGFAIRLTGPAGATLELEEDSGSGYSQVAVGSNGDLVILARGQSATVSNFKSRSSGPGYQTSGYSGVISSAPYALDSPL